MNQYDKSTLVIGATLVTIASIIVGAFLYTSAQNRATYIECLKTQERIAALSQDRYVGSTFCSRY